MARLRATATAARSVLDGCEHDGMLSRVGSRLPKLTNRTIKKRETKHIKKQDHAHKAGRASCRLRFVTMS
jgi:hypothetical protein